MIVFLPSGCLQPFVLTLQSRLQLLNIPAQVVQRAADVVQSRAGLIFLVLGTQRDQRAGAVLLDGNGPFNDDVHVGEYVSGDVQVVVVSGHGATSVL